MAQPQDDRHPQHDPHQADASERLDDGRVVAREGDPTDALPDLGRFQGGSGGPRSNDGLYAGSQGYGGDGDQLGYGSSEEGQDPAQQQDEPDGEQPTRGLDSAKQTGRQGD